MKRKGKVNGGTLLALFLVLLIVLGVVMVPGMVFGAQDRKLLETPMERRRQSGHLSAEGEDLYLVRTVHARYQTVREQSAGEEYVAAESEPEVLRPVFASKLDALAKAGVIPAAMASRLAILLENEDNELRYAVDVAGFEQIQCGFATPDSEWVFAGIEIEPRSGWVVRFWLVRAFGEGPRAATLAGEEALLAYKTWLGLDGLDDWVRGSTGYYDHLYESQKAQMRLCLLDSGRMVMVGMIPLDGDVQQAEVLDSLPAEPDLGVPSTASTSAQNVGETPGSTLRMRTDGNSMAYGPVATDRGFYEVHTTAEMAYNWYETPSLIHYTDLVGRRKDILCSDPACLHRDARCTAWLPYPEGQYILLDAGDGLLVVDCGGEYYRESATDFGTMEEIYTVAGISKIGYDGAKKGTVVEFLPGQRLENHFALAGHMLYVVQTVPDKARLEEEGIYVNERTLLRINLDTGGVEEFYTLNQVFEYPIGVYGQQLLTMYLESYNSPERALRGDWGTPSYYRIRGLDTVTGEVVEYDFFFDTVSFLDGRVEDGCFYFIMQGEPGIQKLDLETGAQTSVGAELGEVYYSDGIDGKVIVSTYAAEEMYCWIDLAGGQVGEMRQRVHYWAEYEEGFAIDEGYWMMQPIGSMGDYYLVEVDQFMAMGDYRLVRVLIRKEDYWEGLPYYIPIDMVTL